MSLQPVNASKRCRVSSGNGAPPDMQKRIDDRSNVPCSAMLLNVAKRLGTPGKSVGFLLTISFNNCGRSKLGSNIISKPSATQRFMLVVMPKTWKSGSKTIARS